MHVPKWLRLGNKGLERDRPKQEGPLEVTKGASKPTILQRSIRSNSSYALNSVMIKMYIKY